MIIYQVLGVDRNASDREIQKAFHKYVDFTRFRWDLVCLLLIIPDKSFMLCFADYLSNIILTKTRIRVPKKNLQRSIMV